MKEKMAVWRNITQKFLFFAKYNTNECE